MATLTKITNIQADLQTYFAKKLLKNAKKKTVLDQFGHKENIPAASSKTIQFTQYADLEIVKDPLTEGVAPAGKALSATPITATIDQLGDYVTLTDLAGLTPKHPTITKALELLGNQASQSYDYAINNTVAAGTAVRYAKGGISRATLTNSNKISWADVRAGVTRLRNSGADTFEDGNYVLVADPSVEADLMDDELFQKAAAAQANKEKANELYKGTIAVFGGVRFVRSNALMRVKGGSGNSLDVHISFLFGKDAYAVTDLQTLKTYKEGPGGTSDPLHQIMTLGWKVGTKSCILNNNFMERIESVSAY